MGRHGTGVHPQRRAPHGPPEYDITNDDTFYPVEDGYRDELIVEGWNLINDIKVATVVVTNEVGTEVFRAVEADSSPRISWNGRNPAGQVLPEGSYKVSMIVRDKNANETIKSRRITLSHDLEGDRTWRPTFTADEVMIGGRVGACGRVKQPARRAWKGSVGLYTRDNCRPRRERFSRAMHHVDLPLSPGDTVVSAALTVDGAKARREQASSVWIRLRNTSISNPTHWWRPWIEVTGLAGPVEISIPAGVLSAEHPKLVWEAKVNGGDKFDLRDFTVELRYHTSSP